MAKRKIDITDKLDLGENPCLVIKGQELEVNADAKTMLKIINKYDGVDELSVKGAMEIFQIIFPEKTRQAIDEMHFSFKDLQTVIEAAMNLIMGNEDEEVEDGKETEK